MTLWKSLVPLIRPVGKRGDKPIPNSIHATVLQNFAVHFVIVHGDRTDTSEVTRACLRTWEIRSLQHADRIPKRAALAHRTLNANVAVEAVTQ